MSDEVKPEEIIGVTKEELNTKLDSTEKYVDMTLDEIRERQTNFRRGQFSGKKQEVTEADKAYWKMIQAKENFDKDFSLNSLLASVNMRPKHQPDIVPYPVPLEDCLELFYAIMERELSVNDDELIIEEVNRPKLVEMVKHFCGYPSLLNARKGIYLYGAVGRGKSIVMQSLMLMCSIIEGKLDVAGKVFVSHRFQIKNVKSIVTELAEQKKPEIMKKYYSNAWCFDDFGMEDTLKLWGNEMNVLGDIIIERYLKYQQTGLLTHATSNIISEQWKDKYGDRVDSRLSEMFNVIRLEGKDKRKK